MSRRNAMLRAKEIRRASGGGRDGMQCPLCRIGMVRRPARELRGSLATIDHILPRSQGGTLVQENRRLLCRWCNEARAVLGHCTAAAACALAVLGRCHPRRVAAWRRKALKASETRRAV